MYQYNDKLQPGNRRPRLYLAKGGEVRKFEGQNVPGFCAVATAQYHQNGKWSSTTYELVLAQGVRPLMFLSPLHGVWGDNLASWEAVASHLELPADVARTVVLAEYPKTAARLDALAAFVEQNGGQ